MKKIFTLLTMFCCTALILTGTAAYSNTIKAGSAQAKSAMPELPQLKVSKVYPVPATTSISFEFSLERAGKIKVIIMDITGRTVAANETYRQAGVQTTQVEIEDLKSGVYFYTLDAESYARAGGRFSKQ
jgi:hypothetical protein